MRGIVVKMVLGSRLIVLRHMSWVAEFTAQHSNLQKLSALYLDGAVKHNATHTFSPCFVCRLRGNREVLVSDTVGFIQKLPTQLVAAFR